MRRLLLLLVACGVMNTARAQEPARADTLHHPTDTLTRTPVALQEVTVTAAPVQHQDPGFTTTLHQAALERVPATDAWDLLRQAGGMEFHEQGQGPGFASNASLRGFSSDHSTDIALWIDGVPINEPMNGHAEGYNDWAVLFPGGVRDIDVIHGPTSALFGNFALAGVVNVRTLDRIRGTQVTASTGSFGRAEGMVLTGFDHGARGGGVLGARYERADGFRPNSRYDVTQGHARIMHDLRPGWAIDAGAELYGGN